MVFVLRIRYDRNTMTQRLRGCCNGPCFMMMIEMSFEFGHGFQYVFIFQIPFDSIPFLVLKKYGYIVLWIYSSRYFNGFLMSVFLRTFSIKTLFVSRSHLPTVPISYLSLLTLVFTKHNQN